MATPDEPLVTIDEIQLEAKWAVDVRSNGVVVSDWAGRAAVPVSVAAELFERAVAERDRLAVERRERHVAVAAKRSTSARPEQGGRLGGLADNAMRRNR